MLFEKKYHIPLSYDEYQLLTEILIDRKNLMQVREEDIARMGKLGIVAAMQPMWAQYASLAETMSSVSLGRDRVLDQYRIGAFLKAGSTVSFGTDFVIMSGKVTSVPAEELDCLNVEATYFCGEKVWSK